MKKPSFNDSLGEKACRYNCAQSVAAACSGEEHLQDLAGCGAGRAPDGVCGALYAALLLAPESRKKSISDEFAMRLGATKCRELKGKGVPCTLCVSAAEEILMNGNKN